MIKHISHSAAFLGLNGWEKWSFAATVAAVVVNAGFFFALLRQIRVGRDGLKESKRATKASLRAVRETAHTRIDAQAPRVSAFLEKPLIHGLKTSNSFGWEDGQQFVLPSMKDDRLYFIVTGYFINEGNSTARIRMNSFAEFLPEDPDDDLWSFAGGQLQPSKEEYLLRPGEKVYFNWSDSHSVEEWTDAYNNPAPPNPHGALFMEVIVTDSFAEGVIDHIYLEMSGRPLKPKEGDASHWRINDSESMVAISYPIVRIYRHEGQEGLQPSWADTYAEWSKANERK
jgi:hypothetical protein